MTGKVEETTGKVQRFCFVSFGGTERSTSGEASPDAKTLQVLRRGAERKASSNASRAISSPRHPQDEEDTGSGTRTAAKVKWRCPRSGSRID